jgi:hypothetical protein
MWKHLAFLSVLAAGGVHAQATVAAVPFPFHVGGVTRPQGYYRFIVSRGVLTVEPDNKSLPPVSVVTMTSEKPHRTGEMGIQFLRYGDVCFLSKVWTPDGVFGTVMTKEEKTIKAALKTKKRPPVTSLAGE